ncbi:MAG: hypothetical protein ABSD42_08605 [Candidatus Bathyarchaeia archaeon]|jgi:hypothetical protein
MKPFYTRKQSEPERLFVETLESSKKVKWWFKNGETEIKYFAVPRSIINQFGLTEYDKLEWILKAEGGELVIIVKPQKGEIR